LLLRGADINARDLLGNTPILSASKMLDEELVQVFLDKVHNIGKENFLVLKKKHL